MATGETSKTITGNWGAQLSAVVLFCFWLISLIFSVQADCTDSTTQPNLHSVGQPATSPSDGGEPNGSNAGEQNVHRPDNMFPNEYDSGIDDTCPNVPADYFHFLSIPFHNSARILRVYCERPCFLGPVVGDWCGYGMQFIDRCGNHEVRIAVYDPSKRVATFLGVIREQHGSNYGGIFMPMALTRDDQNIILRAWMGAPGAGGGMVNYGYAIMAVQAAVNDTTSPVLSTIAPACAVFYDDYGKVVYLGNSDSMPQYPQPGPSHNSGALYFRDLVTNNVSKILEEKNTTYELAKVDTVKKMIKLTATEYEFSDTCPKDENGYWCAKRTSSTRTVPLP